MSGDRIDFVTVAISWHPVRAWLMRNYLADEGIDAFVVDEFVVAMDWLTANAIGGVKVQVPRDQAQWATDVIAGDAVDWLPRPKTTEDPAVAHCETCHSVEVCDEGYSRTAAYLGWLFLGCPIPVRSNLLRCLSCGERFPACGDAARPPFQFSLMTLMTWVTIAACLCGMLRMGMLAAAGVDPAVGETRGY